MATIKDKELNRIKQLYSKDCFSALEISKKLNVPLNAVYYFLRKHSVSRRNPSENNRIVFSRKKATFKVKNKLSISEKNVKIAGIILYWTEGSNWSGERIVDFANSDPKLILIFLRFLRKICHIDENKLRAYLYCYSNQNIGELIKFWSTITKIPKKQFTKPYVRKDFKLKKSDKMIHGLVHIRYNDKKLLLLIQQWMKEIVKELGVDSEAVKRTGL